MAEHLFAPGCQFIVGVTSAGQILPTEQPPYFVLIEQAWRNEGTSHHDKSPRRCATLDVDLRERIESACQSLSRPVYTGPTWTTDPPFRERETAIERARSDGILAVEMEAAALYAFAADRDQSVVCFAYVTKEMGHGESEFAKSDANGSTAAFPIIAAAIETWKVAEGNG